MKNKSFTLIEILVVIIIIGILASVVLFSTNDSTGKRKRLEVLTFSEGAKGKNLDSLISEWNFDGPTTVGASATNDDVKDSWGHNDGIVYGGPIIKGGEDCVSGKCLSFDGDNDYIKTNSGTTLLLPNFTIAVWVKLNGGVYRGIVETEGIGGRIARMMTFPENTIRFHPYYNPNNNNSFVETTFSINEWIYLVGTFDGTFGKLYKNGKYIGSTTLIDSLSYPTQTYLYIGIDSGREDRILDGVIDDTRIYNRALSETEIKTLYNSYNPKIIL